MWMGRDRVSSRLASMVSTSDAGLSGASTASAGTGPAGTQMMRGRRARSAAVLASPHGASRSMGHGVWARPKQPAHPNKAIPPMPPVSTRSSANSRTDRAGTVIELSIPMRIVNRGRDREEEDDDVTCYICANSFCDEEECVRSMTHLGCCTQAICCGCLLKSSKRCTCKEDCDAVISLCPFCREVSAVEALDIFLGTKVACKACLKADERAARAAAAAAPSASASTLDDALDDAETVD